jgi:hypothetical protein
MRAKDIENVLLAELGIQFYVGNSPPSVIGEKAASEEIMGMVEDEVIQFCLYMLNKKSRSGFMCITAPIFGQEEWLKKQYAEFKKKGTWSSVT